MEDRNMAKMKISKKSKRRLIIFGIPSVIAIVYFLVTFVGYMYNFISLHQEEAKLQSELTALQEQKANLKIEIQKLNDPEYVARYAKEKYLYSKDGEYVLKIDTNEKQEEESIHKNNSKIFIIGGVCVLFLGIMILIKRKSNSKH